ncbi:MAG: P-II family nitrogen regulator [Acidobacteriota bacterium]|nr:P-II family nitrogen regulator [Acidobacteriota bacterium]
MKMVFIVYNAAISDEVDECLKHCEIESFTKFPTVYGQGKQSGPHMGTHIWPATNSALMIVCDDEKVSSILEQIRQLKAAMARVGVKAFVFPVEDIV